MEGIPELLSNLVMKVFGMSRQYTDSSYNLIISPSIIASAFLRVSNHSDHPSMSVLMWGLEEKKQGPPFIFYSLKPTAISISCPQMCLLISYMNFG